jgi:very-short-patch-repair endonuclease
MDWRDVARAQSGVVTRDQLVQHGVSEDAVRGLVRRRDLTCLLPGVYAARPVAISFLQRAWAAALWSGGAISHRSAAQLCDLPVPPSSDIHVTVEHRQRRVVPQGVRVHRVPHSADEVRKVDGLPVTSPARTIIDLLRTERFARAQTLFDRSIQLGWLDVEAVSQSVRSGLGRTGNVQLRLLLAAVEPGAHAESERVLHRILNAAAVTGWIPQFPVRLSAGVAYLDVGFPEQMLAIEVDGRRAHDENSDRFESDRARQNELIARGWRVLRFTWRTLNDNPAAVVAKINELRAA